MLDRRVKICFTLILIFLMLSVSLWQTITIPVPVTYQEPAYRTNFNYTYPMAALADDDYRTLIDLHDFKFNVLDEVCNDSTPILLVLVHTSPENFRKRATIRQTWGQRRAGMRVVFMLGYTENANVSKKLRDENMAHRDFAQGNFLDTYKNMTYKHVMVLKYAIYHCPQAKYVLKTDDDVFVNVYTMMAFLRDDLSPNGCSNLLLCKVMRDKPVLRTYRSKWRVSVKEYPLRKYPSYCLGFALVYSQDVVFALYREAQLGDYFWIDDVHVTGTLAERSNVTHTEVKQYILKSKSIETLKKTGEATTQFLFGGADLEDREIRNLWKYVRGNSRKRFA